MIETDDTGKLVISSEVKLKPYIPRAFKSYELMSDAEILAAVGSNLIVDTENYSNYFLIAFKHVPSGKIITFEINNFTGECMNERKLSWIMHNFCTIGFNTIKFDLPIIWYAYGHQHTQLIKALSDEIIFQGVYPKQLEKYHDFKIFPTNHIDLIEVCPLRGSLKLYGGRLHAQRIQDLPFNVSLPITENQIEIVKDYCINDLDTTELLFNNLTEPLKLRLDLTIEYKQDLMSKSDAQIAEAVIGAELLGITGRWPKKPKIEVGQIHKYKVPSFVFFQTPALQKILNTIVSADYKVLENGRVVPPEDLQVTIGNGVYRIGTGGLHSSEKEIAYKTNEEYELLDRDVASYYPAIILNSGLYPKHLGTDFLQVYRGIVERRLAAKKAKNISVSECLKITINGTFGKLGSPYSILYAPDLMVQVTVTGQLSLLMLIEQLELNDIPIASANTDGIVIYCPRKLKDCCNQIINDWEKITGFTTEETTYSAIYSRDVNAYMAVKDNKEIKGKNVYYDPWRGKSGRDQYWKFQKNPNAQICVEAIELLLTKDISIKETIANAKDISKFVSVKNVTGGAHKDNEYLGKVVRWYMSKDTNGTINYIKNNNRVPDTEGAKPAMDLPETFPDDINYDWYIKKTIEMLTEMGYYERPKQLRFF